MNLCNNRNRNDTSAASPRNSVFPLDEVNYQQQQHRHRQQHASPAPHAQQQHQHHCPSSSANLIYTSNSSSSSSSDMHQQHDNIGIPNNGTNHNASSSSSSSSVGGKSTAPISASLVVKDRQTESPHHQKYPIYYQKLPPHLRPEMVPLQTNNNKSLRRNRRKKPDIFQMNPRTIQLHETDCGLACIHTLVNFYVPKGVKGVYREGMDVNVNGEKTYHPTHNGMHFGFHSNATSEKMNHSSNTQQEDPQNPTSLTKVEEPSGAPSHNPFEHLSLPQSLSIYKSYLPTTLPRYMIQHQLYYIQRLAHLRNFQKNLMERKNLKMNPEEFLLAWTIDYAHYLKHHVTDNFLFCTQQIGVHPSYKDLSFYAEVIQDDFVRVNQLFDDTEKDAIPIRKWHLSLEVLKRLIHRDDIYAIIVVDSNRMKCLSCEFVPSESDEDNMEDDDGDDASSSSSSCSSDESWEEIPTDPDTDSDVDPKDFAGHFILLVDSDDTHIFYKDSSTVACNTCICDAKRLDRARLAFGTDEDMLLICMDPNVNLEKLVLKELKRELKEGQRESVEGAQKRDDPSRKATNVRPEIDSNLSSSTVVAPQTEPSTSTTL